MPQNTPGDVTGDGGKGVIRKPRKDDEGSKIGAASSTGGGTVPTGIIYAAALSATDDVEAAQYAVRIARHIDLPEPVKPKSPKKKRDPIIDPLTGETISFSRYKQLTMFGMQLASALQAPPRRGHGAAAPTKTPDPQAVLSYVKTMEKLSGEMPAEFALGYAIDMGRRGVDPDGFRINLEQIQKWDDDTGTVPEEDAIVLARWWTENKSNLISPADIVSIIDPEVSAFLQERGRSGEPLSAEEKERFNQAGWSVVPRDIDRLIETRQKAIENSRMLNDARLLMEKMEAPTWADHALAGAMGVLDQANKIGQHLFADVLSGAAFVVQGGQALLPGGESVGDAIHRVQEDRQFVIQRINEGGTIGELWAEQYNVPRWTGVAMDFAIGWKLDPLIIGGKLLTTYRSLRVAPALLNPRTTLARGLVSGTGGRGLLNAWDDTLANFQEAAFSYNIKRWSQSRDAKFLMKAAYRSDEDLMGAMRQLQYNFEATKGLDAPFMLAARARLLKEFPEATDEAFEVWGSMLRAHHGIKPAHLSAADDVVRIREGMGDAATERVLAKQPVEFGFRPNRVVIEEQALEEVVPLTLRMEVPTRMLPIPGFGGIKRARLALADTRFGRPGLVPGATVNPGNILKPGRDPGDFLFRRGTRYRTFTPSELDAYQVRAIKIVNSGKATETNIIKLAEEMENEAIRRIGRQYGVPEGQPLKSLVDDITKKTRAANKSQSFGVWGDRPEDFVAGTFASRPLTETQLIDEYMMMDPVLIRKTIKRHVGSVRNMVRMAPKELGDEAALWGKLWKTQDLADDILHTTMRAWKALVVARPAYIPRVILGDENLRFLATNGSLMERVLSHELLIPGLKKKIPGFRQVADRVYRRSIKVGDETFELNRPGLIEYEPMANTAARQEELIEDLMRRTLTNEKTLQASGSWGIVRPDARTHLPLWARALNYQLSDAGGAGSHALQSVVSGRTVEQTATDLANWARGPGRNTVATRIGVDVDDAAELGRWADQLSNLTHAYTMGDADIAQLAIVKRVETDVLGRVPEAARPTIHGPLLEAATAAEGGLAQHRLANWAYRNFVSRPENVLNRQPYYKMWKSRAEESYLRMAESRGVKMTDELGTSIDNRSREFALEQVRRIMFDFTENTRLGERVGMVLPFMQPWAEAYSVWGHILVHRNPALIGYASQLGRLGMESGFLRRDENEQLVVPWDAWQRSTSWLPFITGMPDGMGMNAGVSSLNLFMSSTVEVGGFPIPVPSVSPGAGLVLRKFLEDTENPYLQSYLFEYGPGTPVVSSWMERTARAIKPDAFNDDRDRAVAMDFLKLYQFLGTDVDSEGNQLSAKVLKERALEDAQRLNANLAITGAIFPTAGRFTFPPEFQAKEQELDDLIEQYGLTEGRDIFIQRNPDLTLMTVGKTITARSLGGLPAPRIPTSDYAAAVLRQPGFAQFAKRYPAWSSALILAQDEQWDDTTMAAFAKQVHDNLIRYRTLDEFLTAGQDVGFYKGIDAISSWYYPKRESLEERGLTDEGAWEDNERQRRQELALLLIQFPRAARKAGIRPVAGVEGEATWPSMGATPPPEIVLAQAREIAAMDSVAAFPAIQGLKAYLAMRDPIEQEMKENGIASITDTTAERLGGKTVITTSPGKVKIEREPVSVFVQGGFPAVQAATERAIALWNDAVGGTVLKLVPDGTEGAVPIRLATERNGWYQNVESDEEAEFTEGEVRGTRTALLNETDLTLAHELGHALGLHHPATGSETDRYIPATEQRIERRMEERGINDPSVWHVAPTGLMGNEMHKNDPDFRGLGPSEGEIEFLREMIGFKQEQIQTETIEGGLTERFETGKAAVIEAFPEFEPFLNSFFDNDLVEVENEGDRHLRQLAENEPEQYEAYTKFTTRFKLLQRATSRQETREARTQAFNDVRDYVDNLYRSDRSWMLRDWFESKSFSFQEDYKEGLRTRPPVFYNRFDWELAGLKLTDKAAEALKIVGDRRADITILENNSIRYGEEFLSGNAYETLDAWVANYARQNKNFAKAVNAINTWGYGIWQSELVEQQGKAGFAWRAIRDYVRGLNDTAIQGELHGPDSFDSDEQKQWWLVARDDYLFPYVQELREWSPAFDKQVEELQVSQLRGDPFVEWLMPDAYFPLGVVEDPSNVGGFAPDRSRSGLQRGTNYPRFSNRAEHLFQAVKQEFPRVQNVGIFVDKNIKGTSTPSEHAYGAALDIDVDSKQQGDAVFAYLNSPEVKQRFGFTNILWQVPDHYDHIHVGWLD